MADTRCVNPEYQLDVDVLILEYLLYNAIRAQFKVLRPRYEAEIEVIAGEPAFDIDKTEAERLLCAFDAFVQIFKHKRPDYNLTPGRDFNTKVLDILVLLNVSRERTQPDSDSHDSGASAEDSMHQAWLKDQKGLLNDRRQWLAYREMLGRQASQLPMDEQVILEEVGISSWTTFQEMHIDPQRPTRMKLLFSILHRFMSLSSEIAPIMGNINSNWMDLALQVMLQTALEILCGDDGHQANTASDTANTAHEKKEAVPGLIECFAFGYLPNAANRVDISDAELSINAMFSSTSAENPEWTAKRAEMLSEFRLAGTPLPPSTDPKPYAQRIARLRHRFPYQAFETNLLKCLDNFWILNCSTGVSGKPILVQIEEGGLEGMSKAEYEEFLIRVGIKADDRDLFKLKL